jgi:hypothetical protein
VLLENRLDDGAWKQELSNHRFFLTYTVIYSPNRALHPQLMIQFDMSLLPYVIVAVRLVHANAAALDRYRPLGWTSVIMTLRIRLYLRCRCRI